jgi:hypothetical protein
MKTANQMSIDDLSTDTLDRLKATRYDRMIEKHEGPFPWDWLLRDRKPDDMIYQIDPDFDAVAATPEFVSVGTHWVLLPLGREHHPNLTILRWFASQDETQLVIYLTDTTYYDEPYMSGFVAICERFIPESFFVATFYHEWYDPQV